MEVYCRGVARIRHASTDEVFEIESHDLDWDAVGGDNRSMGSEIHYEATIDHPELGDLTWGLWEYPIGIENHHITDAGKHEVIEDFDYGLEHGEPEPDDWLDYEAPANPYQVFMASYHHTGDLLADHGGVRGNDLVNRMIFSQQITALEAYLGDTLLNEVLRDKGAMQRLIEKDEDLGREKFTLFEISSDPDLVERKVRTHLRKVLYHNLKKVDILYNIALGIRIFDLTSDKASIFKAALLRHDCVHRNGYDSEGNELDIFTKEFVQDTADLIKAFVEGIHQAVNRRLV
ncbi:hypothetical protein [Paracoccus siganidrum]|uniref:RiboL-PSP-HEPN domain-containing protein n=1 Tax=Paracoccus siganidrum TaxID=1276757 RepID=A0A419A737_9RHOB|nr:hypothetical protein [Paracoccus siganidrum]RJL15830.1 hypothetical protein D3P05_10630 [Paracoccus siganidrum]RMC29357.1 hypothetical protein C9E82_20370 [Paracoccus siganidrum]